jgi:hypothetical protein
MALAYVLLCLVCKCNFVAILCVMQSKPNAECSLQRHQHLQVLFIMNHNHGRLPLIAEGFCLKHLQADLTHECVDPL